MRLKINKNLTYRKCVDFLGGEEGCSTENGTMDRTRRGTRSCLPFSFSPYFHSLCDLPSLLISRNSSRARKARSGKSSGADDAPLVEHSSSVPRDRVCNSAILTVASRLHLSQNECGCFRCAASTPLPYACSVYVCK